MSVAQLAVMCRDVNTHVHIAHVSCAAALDALMTAQAAGLPMTGETCPHYLLFTAADMDRDGDWDILSASRDDNKVLLYPNLASHRTALFDTQTQYVVSTYREPRMAAGVDLDNDGDQDIVSIADQVVAWHRNDGGLPPNFTRFIITEGLEGGRWIHAADIDSDGDKDLFVADTTSNRIIWFENQLAAPGAMPTFTPHLVTDQAKGVRDVHTADLDGDGATGPSDLALILGAWGACP